MCTESCDTGCGCKAKKPFDPTKPVALKIGGKPVRILCTDAPGDKPIVGISNGTVYRWSKEGRFNNQGPCVSDLVNVPERVTKYLRLPRNGSDVAVLVASKMSMNAQRIGYFEIDYEDGEVVETRFVKG